MGVDPHRDQVHAVGPEGTAAQQAAGAQGQARQNPWTVKASTA